MGLLADSGVTDTQRRQNDSVFIPGDRAHLTNWAWYRDLKDRNRRWNEKYAQEPSQQFDDPNQPPPDDALFDREFPSNWAENLEGENLIHLEVQDYIDVFWGHFYGDRRDVQTLPGWWAEVGGWKGEDGANSDPGFWPELFHPMNGLDTN